MRRTLLSTVLIASGLAVGSAAEFQSPFRLEGGGTPVRVESPGYACPCWADIDRDGKKDLLVGQFSQGKIKVYKNLGGNKLAAGQWLKADAIDAEIPGVW